MKPMLFSGVQVGVGVISRGHRQGLELSGRGRFVARVDPALATSEPAASDPPLFASLSDIPDTAFDFVDLCCPPVFRIQHALEAMRRGKHVMLEKPYAISAHQFAVMRSAAEEHGVVLYPVMNYAFAPGVEALRRSVPQSTELELILSTRRVSHAKGALHWMPDWRVDPDISGGGIIADHGPHSFYVAILLAGALPTRLRCQPFAEAAGVEREATIHVLFSDGSAAEILLTWEADRRHTSYRVEWPMGSAVLQNDSLRVTRGGVTNELVIVSTFDNPEHGPWFKGVFDDFFDQIDHRGPRQSLLDLATVCMRMVEASSESARHGQWIDLDLSRIHPDAARAHTA